MNCKPGDIARIVHPKEYGRIVEVLHAAPTDHEFVLPNGQIHNACSPGEWVVQMQGAPIRALICSSPKMRSVLTMYGACADRWLRPLGGVAVDDEVPAVDALPAPKPQREFAR